MVRVRAAVARRQRRKKVLKQAKGQFGKRSRNFSQAKRSIIKGMTYAYRDRKVKKREFRRLWIVRINAACRESGISYSRFINGLSDNKIEINRKMLSALAVESPDAFRRLVDTARKTEKT